MARTATIEEMFVSRNGHVECVDVVKSDSISSNSGSLVSSQDTSLSNLKDRECNGNRCTKTVS